MIYSNFVVKLVVQVGDWSRTSAQTLWRQLPAVYRQCAVCYTDTWDAYRTVLPRKQYRILTNRQGTNHIERFNNTLRQRLARLVRRTLSFTKKFANLLVLFGFLLTTIMRLSLGLTSHHYLFYTTVKLIINLLV